MTEPSRINTTDEEDDEDLALPADTLAILQSFLADKAQREKLIESDAPAALVDPDGVKPTFDAFEENWVRFAVTMF